MECCFDCRFFVLYGNDYPYETRRSDWEGGTAEGECRRRPPCLGDVVPQQDDEHWRTLGIWPNVPGTGWCGEFEMRSTCA